MLEIVFSAHARKRARERGIKLADVRVAILKPEITLPAYDDLRRYQKTIRRKRIEVVVKEEREKLMVVTLYYLS